MTNLPDEIMIWRSMEKLTHIGTWATERYPAEAVAFVSRADAEAAMAAVVERACFAVSERADWPEDEHGRTEQPELFVRVINAIRDLAPASGLAKLAELRAERDASDRRAGAMLARITALEADAEAILRALQSQPAPPDEPGPVDPGRRG